MEERYLVQDENERTLCAIFICDRYMRINSLDSLMSVETYSVISLAKIANIIIEKFGTDHEFLQTIMKFLLVGFRDSKDRVSVFSSSEPS